MAPRARGSARFLSACESLALQVRPPPELQPRHHPWMTAWVVLTRPAQTTSLLAPSQSSPCLENHPDNPPGLIWTPYYSAGSISWNKFRFFFYIGCVGFVLFSSYPGQSVCPLCRSLNTLRQSRILWDIMTTAEASLCSCRHSSWKAKSCRYEGEKKRVIDRTVIGHLWPPLPVSSSVAGANFVMRQGVGSLLSLSARLPP